MNLRVPLDANWTILYFVYGQVFFFLGIVAALKWRRGSHLDIARALPWLAAFGIAHGIYEWGYIFIPLQAQRLSTNVVQLLLVGHLLLLAISFLLLLQFGIDLHWLASSRRQGWLRLIPVLVYLVWSVAMLIRATLYADPFTTLILIGDGWSRYLLCISAAVLASWGLLRQTEQMRRAGFHGMSLYIHGAAAAFAAYAVVGGLLAPKSPIFPAQYLSSDFLLQTVGIPAPVFRSLCGLAMVVFVTRFLDVFQAETDRKIQEMEHTQILMADRERIGRELHDGIIQNIYAAGLSLEDVQLHLDASTDGTRERVQSVLTLLDQTIRDIRRYIFDLRAAEKALELEIVLEEMVSDLRLDTLLDVELEMTGQRCYPLTPQQVAHLTQIAREALSNVVQHAAARHVAVQLQYLPDGIELTISDDGEGFTPDLLRQGLVAGQGVRNIQERARLLDGECTFESAPGEGTRLSVTIPCVSDA